MQKKHYILCCIAVVALVCCRDKKAVAPLFQLVENSGIQFVNTVQDNDTINILNYRNFYNGGGVAAGDINNDGLADIFFTANQGSNKLYLNQGNLKFTDISAKAGFHNKLQFSTGVVMADINSDGWLDIFVCNAGSMHSASLRSNQLYINNHDLTFTESAAAYGLADSGYTTQVSFFDYDRDGDLDMFKIDNSPVPVNSLGYPNQRDLPASQWNVAPHLKGGGDHLYRNDNGHFVEVTSEAGIHGSLMSFGLGVTVGDINGDGYPDVYVSNDFFERDYLYINQRNGQFKDELESRLGHNSYASMGADFGDINNDGHPEIFTTDMLPADDYRLKTTLTFDDIDQFRLKERNGFFHQYLENTLQLNDGNGHFKDIANYSGVNASEWSWGALMFDADNDGLLDLYVCNGIYRDLTNQDFLSFDASDVKQQMIATGQRNLNELVSKIPSIAVPNKMFRNLGNLRFSDEGEKWGFNTNSFSNGAAYADLDNDGDLDIVVNNVNEPAFVFNNRSRQLNQHHYIGVQLKGRGKNTFAVGSTIRVYSGGKMQQRELIPGRGFQSSVDYRQVFGMASSAVVDSVVVNWPTGGCSRTIRPAIDQYLLMSEPVAAAPCYSRASIPQVPLLVQTASSFDQHVDDDYTDFYLERGIPQMLSHEGPKAAAADVNGDGLMDVFIGGTISKPGQLYLQNTAGLFIKQEIADMKLYTGFVDASILFFDCDKDGDQDLLLCAGGNAALPFSRELQHRLFLNDGKGSFRISTKAFPANKDNVGTAVPFDVDGDGDLDLFIGGRCVTGQYGVTPQSQLLMNDGTGLFTALPAEKMNGLDKAGLITGAVWADVVNDEQPELIVVGEWMAPQLYRFSSGAMVKVSAGINSLSGWWQSIAAADINGDGKKDLVLGNLGENFYLHPAVAAPVKLWLKDIDGNGVVDKIMTRTIDGMDKPVFMKGEIESQLPLLKKQNLRNNSYATKSIQEIFTKDQLGGALVLTVTHTASCVAMNMGGGNFNVVPLPLDAQLSSIKCIIVTDINSDGRPDLLTGGNEFNFQPQLGRLDANAASIFLNDGKAGFNAAGDALSGLRLSGQVRDIVPVVQKHTTGYLFLQNNEQPVIYHINKNRN